MQKAKGAVIGAILLGFLTFIGKSGFTNSYIIFLTFLWSAIGAFIGFIIGLERKWHDIFQKRGAFIGAIVFIILNLSCVTYLLTTGKMAIMFIHMMNSPAWSVFWFAKLNPSLEYYLFYVFVFLGALLWAIIGAAIGALPYYPTEDDSTSFPED